MSLIHQREIPWPPPPMPPSDSFVEYVAAMARGYSIREWRAETPANRAEAIAHWLQSQAPETNP